MDCLIAEKKLRGVSVRRVMILHFAVVIDVSTNRAKAGKVEPKGIQEFWGLHDPRALILTIQIRKNRAAERHVVVGEVLIGGRVNTLLDHYGLEIGRWEILLFVFRVVRTRKWIAREIGTRWGKRHVVGDIRQRSRCTHRCVKSRRGRAVWGDGKSHTRLEFVDETSTLEVILDNECRRLRVKRVRVLLNESLREIVDVFGETVIK